MSTLFLVCESFASRGSSTIKFLTYAIGLAKEHSKEVVYKVVILIIGRNKILLWISDTLLRF